MPLKDNIVDTRKLFHQIMNFQDVNSYLNMELGVWEQNIDLWEKQGMDRNAIDDFIMFFKEDHFGLDTFDCMYVDLIGPVPKYAETIIEETDRYQIIRDEQGLVRKCLKEGSTASMRSSMDHIIDYPVKDRKTFLQWRGGFSPDSFPMRLPTDWEYRKKSWAIRKKALLFPGLGQFGLYGFPRNYMGTEGISYLMYDDPLLYEELLDFCTEYILRFLEFAFNDVIPDWFLYFEDMSYKNGSLMSPELVKKYFVSRYRKINDVLERKGVKHIFVDSDGDISELIPLFLKSGINGVLPLEAAAGMDVVKIRREYPELKMIGGIDKIELTKGKAEIDMELEYKIDSIIHKGGYIPTVDHLMPPDVSYENFLYYLQKKDKLLKG